MFLHPASLAKIIACKNFYCRPLKESIGCCLSLFTLRISIIVQYSGPFYLIGGGLHGEPGLIGCLDHLSVDGQFKVNLAFCSDSMSVTFAATS